MVKGITRQVIVVHAPDPQLFDQAIFVLNENASESGITEDLLLKEAQKAIRAGEHPTKKRHLYFYGAFWACIGSAATGLIWLFTAMI